MNTTTQPIRAVWQANRCLEIDGEAFGFIAPILEWREKGRWICCPIVGPHSYHDTDTAAHEHLESLARASLNA